ncbi:hypothetical protein L1D61_25725 [Vibrio mediterranei]|uniref:AAA family ATPase n=1 Tax=Vibrio mediterranei TaxID=689 RepID=A0A3G4VLH3_9VIBR|nr:AAA family ATPase [Vibrio mediterranei]AYV25039.1 AAA family ATPase [Vibrio mediterranei]MCG9790541.1 hypothetical protein [Vibrio mediterranei]
MAEHLTTPLQIEQHFTVAIKEAFVASIKPINVELLTETMSKRIYDMEPRLIIHGYNEKVIAEQFRYRPADIRRLFKGELNTARAKEMTAEMREAGIPI